MNPVLCANCGEEIRDDQDFKEYFCGGHSITHYDWEEFETNCPEETL